MTVYGASSILSTSLGVAALLVALVTAFIGVLSYYYTSASGRKKNLLERGIAAYRAAIVWQKLWGLVRLPNDEIDVGNMWMRVFDAEEESAFHEAMLYGESDKVGDLYHLLTETAIQTYRPVIIAVLGAGGPAEREAAQAAGVDDQSFHDARRRYLREVKRSASYYLPLRQLHLAKPIDKLPA